MTTQESRIIDASLSSIAPLIGGICYDDKIVVANINKFSSDITNNRLISHKNYFQTNYAAFLLTLSGSIKLSLDYVDLTVTKDQWLGIFPNNVVSLEKISENFYGIVMIISKSFVEDAIAANKRLPTAFTENIKPVNNTIALTELEAHVLKDATDRLAYYISTQNLFKKELITTSFLTYLLELANILLGRNSVSEVVYSTSRKEMLTQKFLHLIRLNAKREHGLSFYADALCISKKYLSIIVRSTTGKTPKEWIANHLIMEAKILFRKPGITIQGIADELGFSDQASFTKFFKNQTGTTPKRFWSNQ